MTLKRDYLWHWTEWRQIFRHTHPKNSEGVQTDGDGDVVDDSSPEVSTLQANISLLINTRCFHYYCGNGQRWLQPGILKDAPFYCQECVRVTDVYLRKDIIQWPKMFFRRPPVHHDDQGALPTNKIDEELEKCVYGESFIHITDRLDKLGRSDGYERNPRRYSVDGDHEQDAHDIALEERFAVVFSGRPVSQGIFMMCGASFRSYSWYHMDLFKR
jgi:hypothetical protein